MQGAPGPWPNRRISRSGGHRASREAALDRPARRRRDRGPGASGPSAGGVAVDIGTGKRHMEIESSQACLDISICDLNGNTCDECRANPQIVVPVTCFMCHSVWRISSEVILSTMKGLRLPFSSF